MILREFKAKIVDRFYARWLEECADNEGFNSHKAKEYYNGDGSLKKLHDRISGKVVDIVEHEYPEGSNDFFEKEDNNFVMFEALFEEL